MFSAPAIQLIDERRGDVEVLRVVGCADDPGVMVRLAQDLLDVGIDGGHVVLDLDGLVVRDPASLCALLARLAVAWTGVAVPVAASDPALRRLLRACGAGNAGFACFGSVDEAAAVTRPSGAPMPAA
jgi:hypothetical protein